MTEAETARLDDFEKATLELSDHYFEIKDTTMESPKAQDLLKSALKMIDMGHDMLTEVYEAEKNYLAKKDQ